MLLKVENCVLSLSLCLTQIERDEDAAASAGTLIIVPMPPGSAVPEAVQSTKFKVVIVEVSAAV